LSARLPRSPDWPTWLSPSGFRRSPTNTRLSRCANVRRPTPCTFATPPTAPPITGACTCQPTRIFRPITNARCPVAQHASKDKGAPDYFPRNARHNFGSPDERVPVGRCNFRRGDCPDAQSPERRRPYRFIGIDHSSSWPDSEVALFLNRDTMSMAEM
jgi:hypothetical protein